MSNPEVDLKILSWNIRGSMANKIKRELMVEYLINTEAGVILIQEPGDLTMEEIQEIRILFQRTIGQVKIIYQKTKMKYGGTMTILLKNWVNRCHSYEVDERKLCRFNIVRLRGKEGKLISIINLYRPHFHSTGANSVVEKLRRYLEENEMDDTYPEKLWEEDLNTMVTKEGTTNAVIVGGDFNKRVDDKIMTWQTLERGQFYNALQQKYRNNPIPATRIPGDTGAIDHIYITKQMRIIETAIMKETELSDHNPITATILGHEWFYYITPRNNITNRVIKSNHPKAIKRFRELLDESLENHKILGRLKELQQKLRKETGNSQIDEFSDIVTKVDRLTIEAEEKAIGPMKDTRNLSKAERIIRYEIVCWGKLVAWLSYSGPNKWKKMKMKRIMKIIGKNECEVNTITLQDATLGLKQAWDKWKQREETKWRISNEWRYYDEAKGRQALGDTREVETIIDTLKHQTMLKTLHARIKRARGKNHGEGLTILELEAEDGTRSQVYQKEQIERIAMDECYKKVHTADKTTLWSKQVANILKTNEGPDQWKDLYDSHDVRERIRTMTISKGARLFIEEMGKMTDTVEKMDFNAEQYWQSWKKQREQTASDGKINFSHFMCVEKHSIANEVRTQIARIRLNTGITPTAYKRATDLLLLKQPNDFRPHRMRLITLQHAASNHDFKYIGKQINKIGEEKELFSECQYGSRNKKSAAIQALNKSLLIDISRVKKRSLTIIANDAKSCYDRIILWVLYFTMRKFGMSHAIAKTSIETIQDMEHYVSTVHGLSEKHYGGRGTLPNGVLQGNGFAAQAWAAISSILFNIYEKEGFGAEISSATEDKKIKLAGMAFVDDTDLMDMERDTESIQELIQRTQDGLDLWNQLIEVTGGALEPRKTDWCIVRYKKTKGKWKASSMDEKLTLEDEGNKQRIELKRLQHDEARRTLGIWQSGDGGQQKQKDILIESIRHYGSQIKISGLSRREREIGLQSTITRTVVYGAPATSLNKEQAEEINKELRKAAIQGLGVPKTTPIELIHGPSSLNGLQILDYFTFQLGEHLKVLMDNLDTQTRTGELLQMLLAEHTLELGVEESIWEIKDDFCLTMLTDSWIKNTLQAMLEYDIQIRQYQTIKLKKWRMGDKFLMNMFLKIPGSKLRKEQLINIQEVRRFLRVNTLSDILVNGMIDGKVWRGESAIMSISKHKYRWMKASPPTQEEVRDWQHALSLIGIVGPNRRVANTLGSWFNDAITVNAWVDKTLNYISMRKQDTTLYYEKESRHTNRDREIIYKPISDMIKMNEDFQVRVAKIGTRLQMFDIIRDIINRAQERNEQYINKVEIKATKENLETFAMKIQRGTAILVTDASDDKKGNLVAAFGEQLPMLQELDVNTLEGWAQIPSTIDDADSFRGELGGILAAVRFTINVAETHGIQDGGCEIKSDNVAGIQIVENLMEYGYPQSKNSSFDILRIIWKELMGTNIKFRFTWVKGHQDRNTSYTDLEDDARANCKADQMAASKILQVKPIERPNHDMDEGPYLCINKKKIHVNIHRKIREQVNGCELKRYWIKRGRFKQEYENQIDWEALTAANKTFKFSDRVILMKLLSNKAPTAEIMKQRQRFNDDFCPLCNKERETEFHIFQCDDIEMKGAFEKGCKEMKKRLRVHNIIEEQVVQDCISQLKDLRNGDSTREWVTCEDQNALGNNAFINGILHIGLRHQCNGLTGTRRIIKEIFKFRLMIWKQRCHLVNNRENNKKRNDQLREQYESHIQHPPMVMSVIDKKRYMIGVDAFARMTLREKELWIKSAIQIKKKYERLAKKGILRYYTPKRNTETGVINIRRAKKQRVIIADKKQMKQSNLRKWYTDKNNDPEQQPKKRKLLQVDEEVSTRSYSQRHRYDSQEKITRWIRNQHNPGE